MCGGQHTLWYDYEVEPYEIVRLDLFFTNKNSIVRGRKWEMELKSKQEPGQKVSTFT